jgi:hypothetical protein
MTVLADPASARVSSGHMAAGPPKSRTRLVTIVVVSVALITVGCGANDDSSSDPVPGSTASGGTPDHTQPTPQRTAELSAIRTALEFFDARNRWDGPGVRALVADDADVADFAVEAPDDYLAMAVLERTLRWRYLEPACTATLYGAVAQVRCTYVMQNRLSQATGTGPYSGSQMDLEISDGLIQRVTNMFDHSIYGSEVLVPFTEWLNTNHPGDRHVMFFINDLGEVNRSLSPESLALWAERLPEYVARDTT